MKAKLYLQIEKIESPHIRKFTKNALDKAHDQFWLVPSSSSGKFHPPEDQGEGGLIRHLVKASEVAYELARFYNITTQDRDIVVSAAILHDIQKNGIPWGISSDSNHALVAYHWLDEFDLDQPYKNKIRKCVRYHMSRWSGLKKEIERATRPNTNELIVQLSDYFSSRKNVSFLPGISLSEEVIKGYN